MAISRVKVTLLEVAPDDLRPNPWDPRAGNRTPEAIQAMANSIKQVGLLQPLLARPVGAGKYELAFGMTRCEAVKVLLQEGGWQGGVPVEVRTLTDAEMAITALAENGQRKDLTPLEQYRACQRALDTIPDLTITALAEPLGVERSTLSNNLRVLKLPQVVLERVESGELSAHAAREFLCLMNEDHCHTEDMASVISAIASTHGWQGAPDWRAAHVREQIRERVYKNEQGWRPLAGATDDEKHLYFGGAAREPSFDVEAFEKEHPQHVHQIPRGESGARAWTCLVKEWQKWQTRGTRELNLRLEKGEVARQPKTEREKRIERALARDPLVREVVQAVSMETPKLAPNLTTAPAIPQSKGEAYRKLNQHLQGLDEDELDELQEGGAVVKLRRERELEDLLTLEEMNKAIDNFIAGLEEEPTEPAPEAPAKPVALTPEQRERLGTRAGAVVNLSRHRGFHKCLSKEGYGPPPFFPDLKECRERCTQGAGYAEEYQGGRVLLYCFNEACYEKKLARGKEVVRKDFQARMAKDDAQDQELAQAIAGHFRDGALARLVATALVLSAGDFQPYSAEGLREFRQEPRTMIRVREMLDLSEPRREGMWSCLPARGEVLKALAKASGEALPEAAAQLLVYALRSHDAKGIGLYQRLLGLKKGGKDGDISQS